MAKIKIKNKFWLGYLIYVGILIILILLTLSYVWNTMKEYEASQPENRVKSLVSQLEKGDISALKDQVSSKFESSDAYADLFQKAVEGKKLTFTQDSELFSTSEPVYDILVDKKVVAKVSLKEKSQKQKLMFLTISDWSIGSVEANIEGGTNQVKITLPSTYTVSVNGVELGKDEVTTAPADMEGFEYVAEYVAAPQVTTYEVKGLIEVPEVVVKDGSGNQIDLSSYADLSDIVISYPTSEISQELSDYTYAAAKAYSNFFSRDLDGCSESTACLQPYFPEGSYYIDLAEQYRQGDMWMYSDHTAPVFSNIGVSNYIPYSEDCFSVEIVFDKSMLLTLNNETRVDHNDQIYYFVQVDGTWLIADIKDNSSTK